MNVETVGEFEGHAVECMTLKGGGLNAKVLTWGAVLQDLRLDGHHAPLVLGFDDFASYPEKSPYFGALAGRYANRIREGFFILDGERFHLDRNERGINHLHGGAAGTGRAFWKLASHEAGSVTLTRRCPDGEAGYPGNLDVTCSLSLAAPGRLVIEIEAITDAPTLCNFAHHSYFNLDDGGASSIGNHRMTINAGAYLPIDDILIPTGYVVPVDDTPFDFRFPRTVHLGGGPQTYDHNFCLAAARGPLRQAVWAQGAASGVEMEVWTTEPGLQFYDGAKLQDGLTGLDSIGYGPHSGMALEPQVWPDSPNRAWFPQAVLRPGKTYRQVTEFRFRLDR